MVPKRTPHPVYNPPKARYCLREGVQTASSFSYAPGAFLNPFWPPLLPPNLMLLLFPCIFFPNGSADNFPKDKAVGCRGVWSSVLCSDAAGGERG